MPRVRCPRCNAVIQAMGETVSCSQCGLSGRVEGQARPQPKAREPWTFTVDLRKASPARWSTGTKAFSMFVLIAAAFVAGGLSGVALEKARTDIAADLEGSFLSRSDRSEPTGASDPVAESNVTPLDPTDTDSTPDPDLGTDAGPDPDPTDPPTAGYEGIQGQGSQAVGPFSLPAGLVQVEISYHGDTKFFTVKLNLSGETKPAASWGASDSGSLSGTVRYGSLQSAGQYYLRTNAAADETWEIDLLIPDREPIGSAFSKTGNGDGGLGPYRFGGSHKVTFDTASSWTYDVRAFDDAGRELACSIRFGGPGKESATCTVPNGTLVYFDVSIKASDQPWRLTGEGV